VIKFDFADNNLLIFIDFGSIHVVIWKSSPSAQKKELVKRNYWESEKA
jgi:hypothetical protein